MSLFVFCALKSLSHQLLWNWHFSHYSSLIFLSAAIHTNSIMIPMVLVCVPLVGCLGLASIVFKAGSTFIGVEREQCKFQLHKSYSTPCRISNSLVEKSWKVIVSVSPATTGAALGVVRLFYNYRTVHRLPHHVLTVA